MKRIGGGGFGDVWLARQTNVDREVAVKVGHAPIQDETIRLRFDRECKALGRLSGHANIVDVFTAGSLDDGRPYLVLEYVDGGTLWQRLKRAAVPENELVTIGLQLAGALDKAHTSGILHRDLKPENILMRSTGEAVLGDFGIARLQDGANTTSAAITASVAYAAPEVLGGTKASVASDLYGVGICLLAAVIRTVPFVEKKDESIHPIINRVLSESPPPSRGHGISEELAAAIDWTLAKKPEHRPQDAKELLERFKELRDRNGPITPAPSPTGSVNNLAEVPALRSSNPALTAGDRPAAIAVAQKNVVESPPISDPNPLNNGLSAGNAGAIGLDGTAANSATTHGATRGQSAAQAPLTSTEGIRAFAFAYAGTVIIGGLIIYLLAQLIS